MILDVPISSGAPFCGSCQSVSAWFTMTSPPPPPPQSALDMASLGLLFVTAFLRWMDCHKPLFLCTFAFAVRRTRRRRRGENTNRVMVLATSQKRVYSQSERPGGFRGRSLNQARISSFLTISTKRVPCEKRMGTWAWCTDCNTYAPRIHEFRDCAKQGEKLLPLWNWTSLKLI